MTIAEAIQIQKDFVARKYHIYKYNNEKLKESMRILTKAYDELWQYVYTNYPNVIDNFLMESEDK